MILNRGSVEGALSGGGVLGLVDGTEPFCPGLIEALGGFIVADGEGDRIQWFEGGAGLEVLRSMGQGAELVAEGHHPIVAVVLADAARVIDG